MQLKILSSSPAMPAPVVINYPDIAVLVNAATQRIPKIRMAAKDRLTRQLATTLSNKSLYKAIEPFIDSLLALKTREQKHRSVDGDYESPFRILTGLRTQGSVPTGILDSLETDIAHAYLASKDPRCWAALAHQNGSACCEAVILAGVISTQDMSNRQSICLAFHTGFPRVVKHLLTHRQWPDWVNLMNAPLPESMLKQVSDHLNATSGLGQNRAFLRLLLARTQDIPIEKTSSLWAKTLRRFAADLVREFNLAHQSSTTLTQNQWVYVLDCWPADAPLPVLSLTDPTLLEFALVCQVLSLTLLDALFADAAFVDAASNHGQPGDLWHQLIVTRAVFKREWTEAMDSALKITVPERQSLMLARIVHFAAEQPDWTVVEAAALAIPKGCPERDHQLAVSAKLALSKLNASLALRLALAIGDPVARHDACLVVTPPDFTFRVSIPGSAPIDLPANRMALSQISRYFSALLTGAFKEAQQPVVAMREVDLPALAAVVTFSRTGDLSITPDIALPLLVLADFADLSVVTHLAQEFVVANATDEYCDDLAGLCKELMTPVAPSTLPTPLPGYLQQIVDLLATRTEKGLALQIRRLVRLFPFISESALVPLRESGLIAVVSAIRQRDWQKANASVREIGDAPTRKASYSVLAQAALDAQAWKVAAQAGVNGQAWEVAIRAARQIDSFEQTEWYEKIVLAAAEVKAWEIVPTVVQGYFDKLRFRGPSYLKVFQAAIKDNAWEAAISVTRRQGHVLRDQWYPQIADAAIRAKAWKVTENAIFSIKEDALRSPWLPKLAHAAIAAGAWEVATRTVEYFSDTRICHQWLERIDQKRFQVALDSQAWETAMNTTYEIKDVSLRNQRFQKIGERAIAAKDWKAAEDAAHEITDATLRTQCHDKIIQAILGIQPLEAAERIAWGLHNHELGQKCLQTIIQKKIHRALGSRNWEAAISAAHLILDDTLRDQAFQKIFQVALEANAWEVADGIVREFPAREGKLCQKYRQTIAQKKAQVAFNSKDWESAIKATYEMFDEELTHHWLQRIVLAALEARAWDFAEKAAQRLLFWNDSLYSLLSARIQQARAAARQ